MYYSDKVGANASRVASWAAKDGASAWMHGYWMFDWADSYRKLESVVPVTVGSVDYLNVSFVPNGGSVDVGLQVSGVMIEKIKIRVAGLMLGCRCVA